MCTALQNLHLPLAQKLGFSFSHSYTWQSLAKGVATSRTLTHCMWREVVPVAPGGASGKEPACQCPRWKKHRFDPGVGKIHWRRKWQPTLVCLLGKNPMDRVAWQATVRRVAKSQTWLSDDHTWGNLGETPTFLVILPFSDFWRTLTLTQQEVWKIYLSKFG